MRCAVRRPIKSVNILQYLSAIAYVRWKTRYSVLLAISLNSILLSFEHIETLVQSIAG